MSVTDIGLTERIKEFMENEARSGSMDFGCVMPMYVYRMWGGKFSMEDIENGLREIRNEGVMERWVYGTKELRCNCLAKVEEFD